MKKMSYAVLVVIFIFSACKETLIEPENQFVQIYFKYDFKNELNTFNNTYQKDLVLDGVVKVNFWLSEAEQNEILNKSREINFFTMPDTFKYIPQDGIRMTLNPNPGEQILRIKYHQNDETVTWTYPLNEEFSQVKDLIDLNNFIISIIESKPEFKKLPPAKGGYL